MNRKLILSALLLAVASGNLQAAEESNMLNKAMAFIKERANPIKMTLPVAVAVLAARPVYRWVKDRVDKVEGNGLQELINNLVGVTASVKDDEKGELRLHAGSADLKVTVPTADSFPFGDQERSAKELLHALRPQLDWGFADKKSPLTAGEEEVRETRVYAKLALGAWAVRLGCDLKDFLMVPAAMVAIYLASDYLPEMPAMPKLPLIGSDSSGTE